MCYEVHCAGKNTSWITCDTAVRGISTAPINIPALNEIEETDIIDVQLHSEMFDSLFALLAPKHTRITRQPRVVFMWNVE